MAQFGETHMYAHLVNKRRKPNINRLSVFLQSLELRRLNIYNSSLKVRHTHSRYLEKLRA